MTTQKLVEFFTSLPQNAIVEWYLPTVAMEAHLSADWCDIYFITGEHESCFGVTFYTEEYHALVHKEEEDSSSCWNPLLEETVSPHPRSIVLKGETPDPEEYGALAIKCATANRMLQLWAERFLNRPDIIFRYREEWDTSKDPCWAALHESIRQRQEEKDNYYQIAPGVMASDSVMDTLLSLPEEERTAISTALSDLFSTTDPQEDEEDWS